MHCEQKRGVALSVGAALSPTVPSLATENPASHTQRRFLPILAPRDVMTRALANLQRMLP